MNKAVAIVLFVLGLAGGILTGKLIEGPADIAHSVGNIVKTGATVIENNKE